MPCSSACCGPARPPQAEVEPETLDAPVPAPAATSPLQKEIDSDTDITQNSERKPQLATNLSNDTEDVQNFKDDCCSEAPDGEDLEDKDDQSCCAASTDTEANACVNNTQTRNSDCCDVQPKEEKLESDCDAGCCAPSIKKPTQRPCCSTPGDSETEDCCSNTQSKEQKLEDDCGQGCCASSSKTSQPKGCCDTEPGNDTCKPKASITNTAKSSTRNSSPAPPCCKDKPSPCCDTTCIDRLALRECKRGGPIPRISSSSSFSSSSKTGTLPQCSRGKDKKPCSEHDRTTREYYQAKLDAIGCICRALLALGQESCCVPSGGKTGTSQKQSKRDRGVKKVSSSCGSSDSCRGTAEKENVSCGKVGKISSKPYCSSGIEQEKDQCGSRCCTISPAQDIASSCPDACCSSPPQDLKAPPIDTVTPIDVERGTSGREHIILSISGMTCTGCETKLTRTLSTLPTITNLKTSLVLARAQFDLDLGKTSVEDVIRHLERTTEFKCERITNRGSSIDVICTGAGSVEELINGKWPAGVVNVTAISKDTIRVDYDAKIVGARDLVERGWKHPLQLAPPRGDPSLDTGSKHVRRVGYFTLLSAILTIPVLVLAWAPLPEREIEYSSASLALATIIQVLIAGPFYPKAMKALIFSRVIEMDLLIVLSTSAAYIFSVVSFGYLVAGSPLSTGEFFETSTLLVTLIMVGRYVAALARQKAVESISIRSLQTSTATIIDDSGEEKDIDFRLLQYGDVFKTLPECRIPTDGTVVAGVSEVNESMVTGESRPVEKGPGSSVVAGSINGSGILKVRLTRLPEDNTISTIAAMVDEAKLSKPKIQDIADRVASYFVPVVVALAVITFVAWVGVGMNGRGDSGSEATIQAITYAITVLIVSCPCAIGLAVPMVIVIATGIAADRGVVFKTAESIEQAYKTTDVVFDKTGTLTEGKLSVVKVEYVASEEPVENPGLLLSLLDSNKHPVSIAIAACMKEKGIKPETVIDHNSLPGKGVEGTTPSGRVLRAGNSTWLNLSSHPEVRPLISQGYTVLCFTIDDTPTMVFGLTDTLRPDAISTVTKLQEAGIAPHILSGDDSGAVEDVAAQLNIPLTNVRSRCTPASKRDYVQDLVFRSSEHQAPRSRFTLSKTPKRPTVLFIGDGTNDAPALAASTIGIHINTSSSASNLDFALARSAADIILVSPRLTSVLTVIGVSRVAIRRIAFNFCWSFVYNLFAVLLAAGAFVGVRGGKVRIPPEFAGLGELVSVLPVVIAAAAMRWARV